MPRYDDYRGDLRTSWHTPTYTPVFGSPDYRPGSPVYTPDDSTMWSVNGCTAGNGEKFDPCSRSSINIAQVGVMFL